MAKIRGPSKQKNNNKKRKRLLGFAWQPNFRKTFQLNIWIALGNDRKCFLGERRESGNNSERGSVTHSMKIWKLFEPGPFWVSQKKYENPVRLQNNRVSGIMAMLWAKPWRKELNPGLSKTLHSHSVSPQSPFCTLVPQVLSFPAANPLLLEEDPLCWGFWNLGTYCRVALHWLPGIIAALASLSGLKSSLPYQYFS